MSRQEYARELAIAGILAHEGSLVDEALAFETLFGDVDVQWLPWRTLHTTTNFYQESF